MRALNDTRLCSLLDHDRLGGDLTPHGRAARAAGVPCPPADDGVRQEALAGSQALQTLPASSRLRLTAGGVRADNAAYVAGEADSLVTCAPCTALPQDVQVNFSSRLEAAAAQGFPH